MESANVFRAAWSSKKRGLEGEMVNAQMAGGKRGGQGTPLLDISNLGHGSGNRTAEQVRKNEYLKELYLNSRR